jgi:hypothetical protein
MIPLLPFMAELTAREYVDRLGNQVHPILNDAVFQDNNAPHSDSWNCSVMVWFEEHEGELQRLPSPAQSPEF